MLIDDEIEISAPIIEEFLYLFDDEAGMVDAQTYSETVITSQIFADESINPFEPLEAETPLPGFCVDQSAQEDFDAAASELAAEQTRREYAE